MAMRLTIALALWASLLAPAVAQSPASGAAMPPRGDIFPVNYSIPENWICRPGVDDGTCSANLDAMAVDAKGERTPASFVAAADPKIDCFYVYPTASNDPTLYSDLKPDAAEKRAVHGQAARLREKCRLFVPVYHSFTMTALRWAMAQPDPDKAVDFNVPYADVVAAWRSYLAHDNKGRGVVLIGHSQGAILLKRLIAEKIDGKPAQKLLVAAYLAGNRDLSAKSFKSIPPCAAADQTGCLIAWSSYRDGQPGERFFGGTNAGEPPLCVNPAALAGGRGPAKPYLSKPALSAPSDPPYVEPLGQISSECVTDDKGAVLRIHIEPDGKYAGLLAFALNQLALPGGWGLHTLDISLVQGNIVDLLGSQSAAWVKSHP
jgi:hypothetical protein